MKEDGAFLARKLIYTEQGKRWLRQFDDLDQETAIFLANSLTLVSHTEFRRKLEQNLEEAAADIDGPIAVFAIRELPKTAPEQWMTPQPMPFFSCTVASPDGRSVAAVEATSDLGSEAISAQIIRQLARGNSTKFVNHPTLSEMRARRCRAIFLVDDFIGSGNRVREFVESLWLEPTIKSWWSTKHIAFHVIAYSATESGMTSVQKHKSKPTVRVHRDATSFDALPIKPESREAIRKLCGEYGKRALKGRKNMWFGYKQGMCSIVFEHGCPNNTPAILWEFKEGSPGWTGLFPYRTVSGEVASVFPPEVVRGDSVSLLTDMGQKRLAKSGALSRTGETGKIILVVLAMIAKGHRKRSSICFATGLSSKDCERIIERCIKWKFLSPQRRITPQGLSELNAARKFSVLERAAVERGSDYYYPRQLRQITC
ncbi:phosphoribosyltransferase-like protein [Rhizobium leguminosarum]|uniref:phosphoribosyltransferase-like protein n=1 Tax=Rhizobium leguminosarum TaxID=384 RepID=UPI003F885700